MKICKIPHKIATNTKTLSTILVLFFLSNWIYYSNIKALVLKTFMSLALVKEDNPLGQEAKPVYSESGEKASWKNVICHIFLHLFQWQNFHNLFLL